MKRTLYQWGAGIFFCLSALTACSDDDTPMEENILPSNNLRDTHGRRNRLHHCKHYIGIDQCLALCLFSNGRKRNHARCTGSCWTKVL